jgi:hypothetical protein
VVDWLSVISGFNRHFSGGGSRTEAEAAKSVLVWKLHGFSFGTIWIESGHRAEASGESVQKKQAAKGLTHTLIPEVHTRHGVVELHRSQTRIHLGLNCTNIFTAPLPPAGRC